MTIHVAKGLEFPVVCCPRCGACQPGRQLPHLPRPVDGRPGPRRQRVLPTPPSNSTHRAGLTASTDGSPRRAHPGVAPPWSGGCPPVPATAPGWPGCCSAKGRVGDRSGPRRLARRWTSSPRALRPRAPEPTTSSGSNWCLGSPSVPMRRDLRSTVDADDRLEPGDARPDPRPVRRRWSFTAADRPRPSRRTDRAPTGRGRHRARPRRPTLGDASGGDEQHRAAGPVRRLGGAAFGTMVPPRSGRRLHRRPGGQLTEVLDVPWSNVEHDQVPLVGAGDPRRSTPLGGAFGGLSLRSLVRADRLDELDFRLPSVARSPDRRGVHHRRGPRRSPADDDPLRDWSPPAGGRSHPGGRRRPPDQLDRPRPPCSSRRARRVPLRRRRLQDQPAPGPGAAGTVASYHPDRLPASHGENTTTRCRPSWPLGALHPLPPVASARLQPDVHLGPVGYLFVRGMVGPGTDGRTHGVFAWRVPAAARGRAEATRLDGHLPEGRVS